jgi:hypothetical protein
MKRRCIDKRRANAQYYIGRNIKVCDRWLGKDGFNNFYLDLGKRPDGMTLDRIDNDMGYSPDNCRWATYYDQTKNRRNTRRVDEITLNEACQNASINYQTVMTRLRKGIDIYTALTLPVRKSVKNKENCY